AVVASPAAFAGISGVAGRDLLVAGKPAEFSRAVVSLLRDSAARERFAAAGRSCVEKKHNWSQLLERLEDLVAGGDQLAQGPTRPSSPRRGGNESWYVDAFSSLKTQRRSESGS